MILTIRDMVSGRNNVLRLLIPFYPLFGSQLDTPSAVVISGYMLATKKWPPIVDGDGPLPFELVNMFSQIQQMMEIC